MSKVIERLGTTIDEHGYIHHNDQPAPFEYAELLAGIKLDRRKNYAIINGEVCESAEWTMECTSCEGGGCYECGYQGKVRRAQWVPTPINNNAAKK